uniref:Uncharacterized protein n=1 Tax=Loa loa TaxID=7209 RepID=A0A1I7V7A8_LOALO
MSSSSSSSLSSSSSSSSIKLSSLATIEISENGKKVERSDEPISPKYVIPITPVNISPTLVPSYLSYGISQETNFDHNDVKYQCCHGYMHITVRLKFYI